MSVDLGNIDESTSCTIACTFIDENGAEVTPDSATYRIDTDTATSIVTTTAFDPPDILITSAQNALVANSGMSQIRRVTVHWLYGSSKEGWSDCTYTILPLKFAP
jgi:hypothetical protein